MVKWWSIPIAAVLGALLCGGIVLWASRGAGEDLNKQLADAASANNALRTSLADAVATNHDLASKLQSLSDQFDKSAKLLAADDATIAAGQRIINGITANIAGSGGDIGKQIGAIADGFSRLYSLYHTDRSGSQKGVH